MDAKAPETSIRDYRISCFNFPRDRRIGDSQIHLDHNWIAALELTDGAGLSGLGFTVSLAGPLAQDLVRNAFESGIWRSIEGRSAEGLIHRVSRPRGGNIRPVPFGLDVAADQALWDMAAKRAGLPLFRYLGGETNRVPAYASGLCFHLGDDEVRTFYREAAECGYRGYKVKVGHRDLSWDIARLQLVREIVGPEALLMADANEAWSPAEAHRRLGAYADAGIHLGWIEDPVLRWDQAELARLRAHPAGAMVNSGEYVGARERLELIERGAADILNLPGPIGDAMRVGWAASLRGLPVTIGNTAMNVGAHAGAALPEVQMVEDARLNSTDILERPFEVEDGCFILPEEPGHGLRLHGDAAQRCGSWRQ